MKSTVSATTVSSPDLTPWHGSNELALIVAQAGQVVAINPALARKVGLAPEACVGLAANSWCPPEERKAFNELMAAILARQKPSAFEQRWQTIQGWRWIEWEATRVQGGLRLVGRDFSRHRLAEGHFAKLSQALEQVPVGIVLTTPQGHVQYMNAAYCDYSGLTLEDALASDVPLLSEGHPSEASYRQFCATVSAGSVWQGTLQCPTQNGRIIWERVMVSPALDAHGNVTHLLCIRENLTAQRELEEKLANAERRLEDELTAPEDDSQIEEAVFTLLGAAAWFGPAATTGKVAKEALNRISCLTYDIAQGLQNSKQQGNIEVPSIPLGNLIEECANSLRPGLPAGRTIKLENSAPLARVKGEAWPWTQALALTIKHFISGLEAKIILIIETSYLKSPEDHRVDTGTLRLHIKRQVSRGRRSKSASEEKVFRDSDLAFIAGVVVQAGGNILSGFERPWIDDLVIELPALKD